MLNLIAFIKPFLLSYRKYLIYAAIAAGLFFAGHWKGVNDQKLAETNKATVAIQKGVQAHGNKQKEVIGLNDPDLDARLDKWMRD